ncbi:MAG TPA: ABC transporter ATP-binding protein [Gemmatimonadaceae bacterium]|nr:ABC transporter ATP-binding protein [Gemmatimonadaceae bacterium]
MTTTSAKPYSFFSALGVGVRSMRAHPVLASLLLAATISQGTMQGLIIWALRKVLMMFGQGKGGSASLVFGGAVVIFALWTIRVAMTYVGEQVSVRLAHRVEIDSMRDVLRKLLTLSVRFFDRSSQGDLVMSSYDDLKGIRTVTLDLSIILLALSRLAGLAVVAWVLSPKLAVIGLIAVPLGMLPVYFLGQRITKAASFERSAIATLFDSFLQVSSGVRVIKVNRGEARVLERADAIGHDLFHHVVKQADASNLGRLLLESVSGIGLVAVLIVGGRDVAAGTLTWQSLLSLLIAIMAVYAPVLNLLTVYGSVRKVIPNLDRTRAILNLKAEIPDAPGAHALHSAPDRIVLEDVSFAYDGRLVLDSINATIYRGETIGIVGPSGAGKTTLMALMLRLYDPNGGRITFDGVDLRDIKHSDVMDQSAIVLQEPFLFLDTIANNIRISRPNASMDEVIEAAQAANVHDEIERMERGYETMLGRARDARGVSTGQKQRICIAAALLKNAPLLFLDEATSSLDAVSERRFQSALERLMQGRTTFIIAHRLSTLRNADRIMVLEHGCLVGFDTHDELMRSCDVYRRLWTYQMGGATMDSLEPVEL